MQQPLDLSLARSLCSKTFLSVFKHSIVLCDSLQATVDYGCENFVGELQQADWSPVLQQRAGFFFEQEADYPSPPVFWQLVTVEQYPCLLYTSDAADE